MSDFEIAIQTVLAHEGGLTNDPNDAGGITNYGVTLPVLRAFGHGGDMDNDGDIDADDIRLLTVPVAKDVWRSWWNRYGYGRINAQDAATKVFDLAVNLGPGQAHKVIQRASRACGWPVKDDGSLGPITLAAINGVCASDVGLVMLLAALRSEAAGVYRMILAKHPEWECYRADWLNHRAYGDGK